MGEEFEDRDLSVSTFWGVKLNDTLFRDADLSGSTFVHTLWNGVSIDGIVNRLVVNGVDVTDYVNANDRWWPLRTNLEPETAGGIRESWAALRNEWAAVLAHVKDAGPDITGASVGGEWSLRDTLRHLLFAVDKWFTLPVLGDREFHPWGLPNTGSKDKDWPGMDKDADPPFADVVAAREAQHKRFADHIASLDVASLPATVEVMENGTVPALMCFHVVLEEEFEHLRYALRDLAALGVV